MNDLEIKYIPIKDLKDSPTTARRHSTEHIGRIANSIKEFGFVLPVLIDKGKAIIAGHGCIKAARKLKLKTVPTVEIAHLNDAQVRALSIALNKLGETQNWDMDQLAIEFRFLKDAGFDLDLTGFEPPEINMILDVGLSAVEEGDDGLEHGIEPQEAAVTNQGDIWHLGDHRIICADALIADSYKQLLGPCKAVMCFTDPPYNVPTDGHICGLGKIKHREFVQASGEMSVEEFTEFLKTVFKLISKYTKKAAIEYICMDWRHSAELLAAAESVPFEYKNLCVWVKDNAGMGSFYRSQHELVHVFKNGAGKHINNFELGQYGRHRSNVWQYAGANSFKGRNAEDGNPLEFHPTVKPVDMVVDAILDCSAQGDIALDSFLGSGTTLLACQKTKRICYGIELDPLYVDVAIRRWQAMTGQDAVNADTGQTFNACEGQEA